MTPNDLNTSRYQAAQQKLATFYMYEEKSKGIIIQVHVRWHECGGKKHKMFSKSIEKKSRRTYTKTFY